jgi:N-acetylglutamate synthase-like GNAT family acetyltransferase
MGADVRKAETEDAGAIAELATELGYPSSEEETARRLSAVMGRRDHFVAVAVDGAGAVIGWVHACEVLRLESDRRVEVAGLVVREGARSGGVGGVLMEAAEAWAGELGVAEVRLRSNVLRGRAHSFFERRGYRASKTSHVFDKTLGGGR